MKVEFRRLPEPHMPVSIWMDMPEGQLLKNINFDFYQLRIDNILILDYNEEDEELYNKAMSWMMLNDNRI